MNSSPDAPWKGGRERSERWRETLKKGFPPIVSDGGNRRDWFPRGPGAIPTPIENHIFGSASEAFKRREACFRLKPVGGAEAKNQAVPDSRLGQKADVGINLYFDAEIQLKKDKGRWDLEIQSR